ncbi:Hypothetical protein, putative [Bodo saltans]|uniref:Sucraseferredoxin-like protein n=1 Tax=Bodo saltans TaxID=75058 RepID=A0A0S4JXX0_BODSA|nr:Hypothetical protein, putative [Bodo saltans]|eukprot:CUG94265.1 Hypothetical protein, putative [Bodo saltans]
MNSHASIVTRVGAAVLKDIEGLNGDSLGFERSECCGPLPPKLPGSFEPLIHHAFMSTTVSSTLWDKMCSNVEGFEGLRVACKSKLPKSMATAFCDANASARSVLLFKYDDEAKRVHATEYSGEWQSSELPWDAKGVIASDRSDETFIFVCAHLRRDDRCGYCGPVLVELIKQAVAKHSSSAVHEKVRVFPCSHVGGHVYAGNVLLYNKKGSVCIGCFCPSDIEALLDGIATNGVETVPPSLAARVRGSMGTQPEKKESNCTVV